MAILRGRAPLRLGLGGGGTDVEPYSSQFGGRILSVTIDKYAYAFAERGTGDEIAFRSPDRDRAGQASIDDLASLEEDFPLHVAVYRRVIAEFNGGTPFPLQLATQVDAPPGSGLGSSSALVVAMLLTTCALIGSSPAHTSWRDWPGKSNGLISAWPVVGKTTTPRLSAASTSWSPAPTEKSW